MPETERNFLRTEKCPSDFLQDGIITACERMVVLRRQWLVFNGKENFVSGRSIADLKAVLEQVVNDFVETGIPVRRIDEPS